MDDSRTDQLNELNIHLDADAREHLFAGAKWAKLISISVFVFCGLFLLLGFAASSYIQDLANKMSTQGSDIYKLLNFNVIIGLIVFFIAIIAITYFFLFNFSSKIKVALISDDADTLNRGLSSLKTYFIITTVFSLLALLNSIITMFK